MIFFSRIENNLILYYWQYTIMLDDLSFIFSNDVQMNHLYKTYIIYVFNWQFVSTLLFYYGNYSSAGLTPSDFNYC